MPNENWSSSYDPDRWLWYRLNGVEVEPAPEPFEIGPIEKRRVALTHVGVSEISTVFLCVDHNFTFKGPPVLFETKVFGGHHDGLMERYTTWAAAEQGHQEIVDQVKRDSWLPIWEDSDA